MRILIIEDQQEILDFLKRHLEEECFVVDAVHDGSKGARLACAFEYDLIIMDNHLPSKMGVEICTEIRNSGKRTPILMLSVQSDIIKKIELLETGADDYMTKPFSYQELLARVRALLRRPFFVLQDIYQLEDLIVNFNTHTVTRNNEEVPLTKKEFMILEQLIRSQGQVVSRGAIMEHVWDATGDAFSNTIETHIGTLRKKIDAKAAKKLIHTVSGRGYRILSYSENFAPLR